MKAKEVVDKLLEVHPDDVSKRHMIHMGRPGECEELCPHCGGYCTLLHYDSATGRMPRYHICQTCDLKTVEPGEGDAIERMHVPESRDDSPELNFERYAQAIGLNHAKEDQFIVARFRKGVLAYIRWAHEGEADPADIRRLYRANCFAQVLKILVKYETEPKFLDMVAQGYFT